ncbi:MAG: AbrB/MazE/SpoVT family DNA-binding domain-containing protein [Oceanicaulis sp.]
MRERGGHDFEHEQAAEPVRETRKLRKTGNSYGVTLSRKTLDVAGLSPDAPVVVHAEKGRVVISAEGGDYDATIAAGREALAQYRYALTKLGQ